MFGRWLLKFALWLDRNAERLVMLFLYFCIAAIVGGEAIWRYAAGVQTQWGGTTAIHAYIFLSWLGCAYHVRKRSHIRFEAVRMRLSRTARFLLYGADDCLWILVATIVVYHSYGLMETHRSLGGTLEGTDRVPYWLVVATVPLGWGLIALRAGQDLVLLITAYRGGEF